MMEATVTLNLKPSPPTLERLNARAEASGGRINATQAHEELDVEFERRVDEARAALAREMRGWRLASPDLAMHVHYSKADGWALGYQQRFVK